MSASNATAIQNNGNLVARLDVVRTGYDLDHASASDPYLADHQLLSVGMLLDGNNLTDQRCNPGSCPARFLLSSAGLPAGVGFSCPWDESHSMYIHSCIYIFLPDNLLS